MAVTWLAIALLQGASSTPQQFNLECTGTKQIIERELLKEETVPFTRTFRIDLAEKKLCSDQCSDISDIAEVRDDAIIIEKSVTQPMPGQATQIHQINRQTGAYSMFYSKQGSMLNVKAACKAIPFTGLPKIKALF